VTRMMHLLGPFQVVGRLVFGWFLLHKISNWGTKLNRSAHTLATFLCLVSSLFVFSISRL
jgi:uncharacterized membrane protein YecN with MAPEG domain